MSGPIRPVVEELTGQSGGSSPVRIFVSVGTGTTPGDTAFTRMPCGARSTASDREKWMAPAFAVS